MSKTYICPAFFKMVYFCLLWHFQALSNLTSIIRKFLKGPKSGGGAPIRITGSVLLGTSRKKGGPCFRDLSLLS